MLGEPVPLWLAVLANLAPAWAAWRGRWVDPAGAGMGAVLGSAILWGLGWGGALLFALFVAAGSVSTRWGYAHKQQRGLAQEKRGRRSWNHALANCGVASLCALLARVSGDPTLWSHAFAASLAAALADTGGSEWGGLWGRRAFHPISLRPLPPGTAGACSWVGIGAGALLAASLLGVGLRTQTVSPQDFLILWPAALAGAWLDSVLGAVPTLNRMVGHDGRNTLATLAPVILVLVLGSRL